MSTAMIECPKRYSSTSWNAAKNTSRNKYHTILPGHRLRVISSQTAAVGSTTLVMQPIRPMRSVKQSAMFGSASTAMVIKKRLRAEAQPCSMVFIAFISGCYWVDWEDWEDRGWVRRPR